MTRKLQLSVDALRVESFDTTSAAVERRGTVRGHDFCAQSNSTCVQAVCTCNPTDMSCDTTGGSGSATTEPQSVYATCPVRTDCGGTLNFSCDPADC